uniref:Uncharacterized protein n=1 Tax=Siphoviridae sp. ctkhg5 TaxID=2825643 RepID=A0A8S5UDC6_9CAUD|nr:MAG TPA: hypothetical protein [Siphoviridae sp. ctkhg5]
MLTKKERAAIAERLKSTEYITSSTLFKALTGEEKLNEMSNVKSLCIICSVILGLCDTSNMIELPLDKDGEVIKVGDTVYVDDDMKYKVVGYMMRGNSTEVILVAGAEPVYTKEPANNITHKKPVTIASLAKELADIVASDYGTPTVVKHKISEIADQLEKLGDDNAN